MKTLQSAQNINLGEALKEARERYVSRNPQSLKEHQARQRVIPSGNARDSVAMQPFALTLASGEGARLWDVDGHEYVDCMADYTTGLYGYRHPAIDGAIKKVLADGTVRGGPNTYQAPFAEMLVARFPSVDQIRFCNSGTEANLMVLATAAAHSGRERFLTFRGSFYGAVMDYCASEPARPLNVPISRIMATFNDIGETVSLIRANASELAAVILEPMMAGAGCIPADRPFLQAVREACDECNVLLIFDEIVTSRLAPGGLQEYYAVTSDLTTFGKHLGGGLPFGAFGGRKTIMERFDPTRPDGYTHHGTFNGNVLTMAAGLAGLRVFTPQAANELNTRGEALKLRIRAAIESRGLAMQVTGIGSLMMIHFHDRPIRSPSDVAGGKTAITDKPSKAELLRLDMLENGCYFGPGGFIGLSLPFRDRDADHLVASFEEFLDLRSTLLREP